MFYILTFPHTELSSCDLGYHSSSYGLMGSIVARATSTNSLSSALSSYDTCLIRSVTAMAIAVAVVAVVVAAVAVAKLYGKESL